MKHFSLKAVWITMFFIQFISIDSKAQDKWKGWGTPELGYISGSFEPSADLRLQGGLQKKGWNIGLGAAVDYYRFTSIPIYVQGRKYFGNKKGKPFILTSMGVNFPTDTKTDANEMIDMWSSFRAPENTPVFYDMGVYVEAGAGYAFLNKKGRGLLLSLSYTQKRIQETKANTYYASQGMGEQTEEINVYIMNRAALRIGYKF